MPGILAGVKWNPINGKLSGLGGFIAAGYTGYRCSAHGILKGTPHQE
jgi:hypothetical protein